ncbi:hypothetical protein MM221_04280 [Salipaludibacillus sp. LMS25]|uniref:hypothetical protein n=1 Tax=Salipaludibacillus sp. LMS25 TaxID=2924031 RepID=UPI0020D160F0|nr:hypothetical protein [Salipaludibacillus sp. LMS25]UTR15803.1 hypothetical protein MM221_04280 [Salipaludibacillus sp. LMS25]
MNFERLFITESNEFYRVALDYKDLAYIMVTDTLKPTPREYLLSIMDEDGESAENFLNVKIAMCSELSQKERTKLRGFLEDLFSYKPDLDYSVEFFLLDEEMDIRSSNEEELAAFLAQVNRVFGTNVSFQFSSTNKLIQK